MSPRKALSLHWSVLFGAKRRFGELIGAPLVLVGTCACNGRFEFDVRSDEPVQAAPEPEPVLVQDSGVQPPPVLDAGPVQNPYPSATQTPSVVPTVTPTAPALDAGPAPSPEPSTTTPSTTLDAGPPPLTGACRDDTDCWLSTLHCDSQTGLCFECVADEDCVSLGLVRCDVALHRCVECGVDQDCGEGLSCDALSRSCLPACERDSDCPETAHACEEHSNLCIQCDQDWECEEQGFSYCGLGGASCVECREDEHCEAPLVCDTLVGSCVGCRHAFDCEAGESCDPATRTCVRPSVMDARSL